MCLRPALLAALLAAGLVAASTAQAVPVDVRHAASSVTASPNCINVTVEVGDALGACVEVPDARVDTLSAGLRLNRAALGALRLPAVAEVDCGAAAPALAHGRTVGIRLPSPAHPLGCLLY